MEFILLLKKLKEISPDAAYTKRSRHAILETLPALRPWQSPWQIFMHSLQFGSAIALAGVLLVLVLGGFSTWRFLSPFGLASLDPGSLRAEAEAIDAQLHLASVSYNENLEAADGMAAAESPADDKAAAKKQAEEEAKNLGLVPVTSSTEMTLNDVLGELAE